MLPFETVYYRFDGMAVNAREIIYLLWPNTSSYLEPLLLTSINSNPSMTCPVKYEMKLKFRMKLLTRSQTSTVQPLKFRNG